MLHAKHANSNPLDQCATNERCCNAIIRDLYSAHFISTEQRLTEAENVLTERSFVARTFEKMPHYFFYFKLSSRSIQLKLLLLVALAIRILNRVISLISCRYQLVSSFSIRSFNQYNEIVSHYFKNYLLQDTSSLHGIKKNIQNAA